MLAKSLRSKGSIDEVEHIDDQDLQIRLNSQAKYDQEIYRNFSG